MDGRHVFAAFLAVVMIFAADALYIALRSV